MKSSMKTLAALAFLAMTSGSIPSAEAAPADALTMSPAALVSPAARAALQTKVEAARAANPKVFDTVRDVRADMPNLDRQRRGNHALVARILAGLGKDGLLPMLDMLVLREADDRTLDPNARVAWRAGLIEAIGKLRDPFAVPYLGALLDGPESEPHLVFAAAQALARHGGDEWTDKLSARAQVPDRKRSAIVNALGECRREKAAKALAQVLDANADSAELAKIAVDALGMIGSSWAWSTPELAKTGEGDRTREVAARALIGALPKLSPDNQKDAAVALSTIDLAQTAAWMQDARTRARAEDRQAFDRALGTIRK